MGFSPFSKLFCTQVLLLNTLKKIIQFLKRCSESAVTFMTDAICFHCSGVGSVPVGLWAQAWRTKMENSGALWGEGSYVSSDGSRPPGVSVNDTQGKGQHISSSCANSETTILVWVGPFQTLPYRLIQRPFPAPPDTMGLCLLFILIAHLQIIQETLEIESSLRCIPIVIGPNVFKSSSSKHTVMILCKQKGETVNDLTKSPNWKGHMSAAGALIGSAFTGSKRGEQQRLKRMTVTTKNKFNQSVMLNFHPTMVGLPVSTLSAFSGKFQHGLKHQSWEQGFLTWPGAYCRNPLLQTFPNVSWFRAGLHFCINSESHKGHSPTPLSLLSL